MAHSRKKNPLFKAEERKKMIEECFKDDKRVRVDIDDGLLAAYALPPPVERAAVGDARRHALLEELDEHLVVDGAIDTEFIRSNFPERYALKAQDGIVNPEHIADSYWMLHQQPRANASDHVGIDVAPHHVADQVDDQDQHAGDHREPVLAELPPHQLPLRGEIDPLLLGRHLLTLGVTPGPEVGRLLKVVYERQLDGEIVSIDDAIAAAKALLRL